MEFPVRQGSFYIGGGDRPSVFMSKETIRAWVASKGFADVTVLDRSELPKGADGETALPFDYRATPGYSDDWNTLVQARRVDPDGSITLPASPAWFIELPKAEAPKPGTGVVTPPTPKATNAQVGSAAFSRWAPFAVVAAASAVFCGYRAARRYGTGGAVLGAAAGALVAPLAVPITLAQGRK